MQRLGEAFELPATGPYMCDRYRPHRICGGPDFGVVVGAVSRDTGGSRQSVEKAILLPADVYDHNKVTVHTFF